MTLEELYAAWTRYMHRSDLAGDLDLTFDLAGARIDGAVMGVSDLPEILADNGEVYLHAGLIELADLAQDERQLKREIQMFDKSVSDFQMNRSIDAGLAVMTPPYTGA